LFVPLAIIAAYEAESLNFSMNKIRYGLVVWCVLMVGLRIIIGSLNINRDSSRLAKEIRKRYPHSVEEIVFVNTRPALGLQLYTGSDIERVSFEDEGLAREVQEKKSRLWLVPKQDVSRFTKKMTLHSVNMQEMGSIEGWRSYVLFKELDN